MRNINRFITMPVLFAAVLALFFLISLLTDSPSENITDSAALDGFDFSSRLARLYPSCFERYPGALYAPEDFAAGLVTQEPAGEHPMMEFGHTTYRLILTLESGAVYGIAGNAPTYAHILWIDGEVYSRMGTPGTSAEETETKTGWFTVYFTASEKTEIIIRRSDYVHASGGQLYPLYIGGQPLVTAMANGVMFRVTFIVGVTLMAALFSFGIFLFFNGRRNFLWFALACVTMAVRTLIVDHKVIMVLFPDMIWAVSHRLEYMATLAMNLFLFMYITRMFRLRVRHPVNLSGILILVVYTPLVLFAPPLIYTAALRGMRFAAIIYGMAVFVWLAYRMVKDLETRRVEHILILFGTLFYIGMVLVDTVLHNTGSESNYVQLGMLVFITANTMALSLDFTRTETALENAKQLSRMKTEYLANMSHEINTPLTVIATGIDYADKYAKSKDGAEKVRNALGIIRDETQRLGRMVDGMLKLAAMSDSGENRKRADFAAMLKNSAEVFRLMLEKQNNELGIDIVPGLPDVYVEADRFSQVLTNLFSNAACHTRNGQVSVAAMYDQSFITVRIADTGEGIPPDLLPRVFERGVSGGGGTGYGLYLCKIIIEAHGGAIAIESETGKGTAVTFTVPVYGGQEAGYQS